MKKTGKRPPLVNPIELPPALQPSSFRSPERIQRSEAQRQAYFRSQQIEKLAELCRHYGLPQSALDNPQDLLIAMATDLFPGFKPKSETRGRRQTWDNRLYVKLFLDVRAEIRVRNCSAWKAVRYVASDPFWSAKLDQARGNSVVRYNGNNASARQKTLLNRYLIAEKMSFVRAAASWKWFEGLGFSNMIVITLRG